MTSTEQQERRRILVTGATGKQGGAVVKALLEKPPSFPYEILVLTRNTTSPAATLLASSPMVKVIKGDLNHAAEIFEQTGGVGSVWAVFSVQVPDTKVDPWSDDNKEFRQGADLIDASIANGVQHFVQSTVDRGGAQSDNTPTDIPHFITKHRIEKHLMEKCATSDMNYTILRPVAFMDLIMPNFFGRTFGVMVAQLGDKPLQVVATKDIGIFAAQAVAAPDTDEYKNAAISLAGDEVTLQDCKDAFWKSLHRPMPLTYSFVGTLLKKMVPEVGLMFQWFKDVGYGADIQKCRMLNSQMLDLPTFLKQESAFKQ